MQHRNGGGISLSPQGRARTSASGGRLGLQHANGAPNQGRARAATLVNTIVRMEGGEQVLSSHVPPIDNRGDIAPNAQ